MHSSSAWIDTVRRETLGQFDTRLRKLKSVQNSVRNSVCRLTGQVRLAIRSVIRQAIRLIQFAVLFDVHVAIDLIG